MNKNRYRLIFDKHSNTLRPVAECVVSRSDVSSRAGETSCVQGRSGSSIVNKALNWAIITALLLPWSVSTFAQTLPTGGQVGVGAGSIQQSGAMMNIHQQSQKMGINWQSYNIGAGNTVNYQQPNAQAIALNRVIGNSRSEIYGNLNANGKVFLINQNGILFGRNAQINVGGLLATTKNMSDEDFMNEQYHLLGNSASEIINQGNLHAENGAIVLAADTIKNTGTITTPNGRVILAAGQQLNLSIDTFGDIQVAVTQSTLDALIENKGLIAADNGEVYLTAHGKEMLQKSVINMEGVIQAKSGKVKIDGSNADDSGNVIINDGTIDVSNDGSENNGKGGSVTVIGKNIGLLGNAKIKADGKYGGGTVLIGGDYLGTGDIPHAQAVVMQKDALIEASATDSGKGGKVILWSDKYTGFFGAINAKGGVNGGDGGFVETSSKDTLSVIGGRVKANAENGQRGEWLLDPGSVNIRATGSTTASNTSPPNITWEGVGDVLNTDITDALNTDTDVTITTGSSGSMRQWAGADISKTSTGNATLTLYSAGYLELDGNITSSGGNLNLNFTAGAHILKRNTSNIDVTGNIDMSAGSYLNMYNNITSGGDLNLTSGTYMQQLAGSNINVSGNIGIFTGNHLFRSYDDIISGGDLNINASARIELYAASNIDVGGNIDISSRNNHIFTQQGGDINAAGNIDMSSGTYLDMYKNITSGGDLNLTSGTYMQQLAGSNINVSGNIGISSGDFFKAYDDIISGGDLNINVSNRIELYAASNIDVGGNIGISSTNNHITTQQGGDINAVGNIDMSAGTYLDMYKNITSGGDLNLTSGTYMQQRAGSNINVSGNIGISSGNFFRAYDDIISGGNLNINAAANIELHSTSNIDVDGSIEASSGAINFLRGNITAGSNMTPKDIILIGGNGLRVDTHPIVIDSHGGDITISGNTTTANYRGVSIDRDLTLNAGSSGVVNMTGITNSATHAGFRADGNVDITAAQVNIMGHNINPTSTHTGSRGIMSYSNAITVHGGDLFMNATRDSTSLGVAAIELSSVTADGNITIVSEWGYSRISNNITAGESGTPKNINITSTSGGVLINTQAITIDSHGGDITLTGDGANIREGIYVNKNLNINAGTAGIVNITGCTTAARAGTRLWDAPAINITASQVNIVGRNNYTAAHTEGRGVLFRNLEVNGGGLFVNASSPISDSAETVLAGLITVDGNITVVSSGGMFRNQHDYIAAGASGDPQKNIHITSNGPIRLDKPLNATGDITLISERGDITQNAIVEIDAPGDIVIAAEKNVSLNALVQSTTGNITIAAGKNTAAGTSTSDSGRILVGGSAAGNMSVTAGKVINLYTAGTSLSSSDDTAVQSMRSLLSTSTTSGALHYNSNYSATPSNTSSKFNVFVRKKADLTVSANQATWTKTYDGVANISGITLTMNTGLKGDVGATCNSIVANFDSSNVGSYSTNNYTLPTNTTITNANFTGGVYGFTTNTAAGATTPNVTVNVTKRHVTFWWMTAPGGNSKTYDGTTNAAAVILNEVITSVPTVDTDPPAITATPQDGGYTGGSLANSGVVAGEDLTVNKDYVFDDKKVADNVGIAVNNIALANGTNGLASNYQLVHPNSTNHATNVNSTITTLTGNITVRNITITSNTGLSKTYGTNDTQVNFQSYTLESRNNTTNTGLVTGDTFTGNMGREVGEGVASYNFTNGSLSNTNYNIIFNGSANQYNITQATLTITALSQSKTYDGTTDVGNVSAYTNVGLVSGVTVNSFNETGAAVATTITDSVANVTLVYGDKNAGNGNKTITVSAANLGGSAANYSITYENATGATIEKRNITITSNEASKIYGTNDTQANFQNYTLESRNNTTNTGLVSGDTFTGNMGREGGEGVDLYNFTVGSLDNTNYNITFDGSANQYNITKAELTITALDQSKTYDGSLNVGNVSAYTNVGLLNGVTVNSFNETGAAVATTITDSVANVTLVYGDKNVGIANKTITANNAVLAGGGGANSTANYNITYNNHTASSILVRNITITSNAASKVYGTNDTQANFQNYTLESRNNTTNTGLVSGDTFTGNMGREGGEGVDLYNFTVGSLDNTNYNITFDGSANQYNITKAELTITALDQSKTYDGSLNVGNVSAYTNVGLLNGVTVNSFNETGAAVATTITDSVANVTLVYGDKNAGNGNKTITVSAANLGGSAANYSITYENATGATIEKRNITITSNEASKVYGTNDTQANFQNYTLESRNNTTNTGLVSGDTFTGNMGREAGEGVDLYNFTVGSLDNTNYNITFDGSANQYNITKAELTITALDQSKTYDGSLNVGNVSAYTNVGLLNGVTVNSFNETGAAVATTITDSVANVTLVYGDKNAGNGNKTITVSAANLGGSAANYSITYENATGATIEKRNITITSNEASKVYGTNDTQANFQNYTLESRNNTTNTGLVSGDTFTGNMGREGGEGVDLYNFTVGSLDNTNYNITFDGSANQYNITKAELTITALDQSKTYDGSLNVGNVSAYTNVGLLNGVTVNSFNGTGVQSATTIADSITNVTLAYGDVNVGIANKTITANNAVLAGGGGANSTANYNITYNNHTASSILVRNITITSNAASKVYGTNDTQANFQNYTLESRNNTTNTGLVSGDTFTGNMGREGGEGVDLYNFTVGSLDNTNYNITFDGSANQYNITKAELTITALDQSKTYDGSLNVGNVSAYTNVGLLNGVTVNSFNETGAAVATTITDSVANVTLVYGDKNAGNGNKTITVSAANLGGSAANYSITYENATGATIEKRNITITSNEASKVYGTNDTQANFQNYTLESRNNTTNTGLVSGDTFTGNMGREGGEGVDLYNFTVGSLDNTNYNITFDGSANQYNITKAELTITALDQSKTYDGSLNVGNVSAYTNVGLLNGVTVNSFNGTGVQSATTIADSITNVTLAYGDVNVGIANKTITANNAVLAGGGGANSTANYNITYNNHTASSILVRNITITSNAASKVYGTNDTQANFQNYTLESRNNTTNTGLVSGDTFTGNMGREGGEGVDLYNFTVGSLDNTNYNITFDGSANQYNITKAELTITALDQSKTYDGSLNVGNVSAYTNVGLLNGVTVNSFNETGAAVATTITDSVANVTLVYGDKNAGNGNKTITVSAANLGGSAANYSITYENATGATIEKRNITITSNEASKVYGTNDTQANFQNYTLESRNNTTNTGLVSGDTFTGNMGREGGEGVDLYNFTVGSLDNTNYNITFDGSANQYNITKAELTITALDQSKTYDGSLNVGNVSAYTNVGLLNGVTVNSFNETGAAVATTITDSVANVTLVYGDKNAGNGNKTITVSAANLGGSAANYSITYENATGATIEKRNITITSNEASKVYGTNDTQANFQNYTLESRNNTTNTGLVSGDTFTGNMGREGGEGVDLYNFTVGSLDNTNYNITFDGSANQYNITKAELTITALDQSKTYDGSLNVGNVSAYTNVGLLNGVTVNSFNGTGVQSATTIAIA